MSASRLSAAAIDWNQRHIALWSALADERRALSGRHALNIARGLDVVVSGMRAALGADQAAEVAPPSAPSVKAQIARLAARLAMCQPGLYPGITNVTGTGPIMDAHCDNLRARIAALRGEPLPAAHTKTHHPAAGRSAAFHDRPAARLVRSSRMTANFDQRCRCIDCLALDREHPRDGWQQRLPLSEPARVECADYGSGEDES